MKINLTQKRIHLPWRRLAVMTATAVFLTWLWFTPPGLLGKADAVGYAVCHRIDARSFHLGARETPLCARCSGMYLGALAGMIFQFLQGRKGAMPSRKLYALLALFVAAFGIDGVNSYLHFFPQLPSLYQPQNWLRLLTGTGMGLAMAAVLAPAFHQTMWTTWQDLSPFSSWRQIGLAIGIVLIVDGLLLTENTLLLYPLAVLSAFGVVLILTMVYTMVLALVLKKDNRYTRLGQIWPLVVGGFTICLLQLAAFDLLRYLWTGTWSGFSL